MFDFLLKDWRSVAQEVSRFPMILLLVFLVVFFSFTTVASALFSLFLIRSGEWQAVLRPLLKMAVFGVATVAAGWGLWRLWAHCRYESAGLPARDGGWLGLAVSILLAAGLLFPNLSEYPWMAPDEAHHMVVARNLAEHGIYGSGRPDTGFRPFDSYDSVGPPVIVPVAGALDVAGTRLAAGRAVMAGYYLVFCALLFFLMRGAFGGRAAVVAVVLATAGFGSVYMGRTLYGEAPALAYVVGGLLVWRAALRKPGMSGWSVLTGVAFGLAVLCKTIVVLSVFPLLGVWIYDRLTFKRILWHHAALPALGGVAVIGAWWMVQALSQHDVADAASGTVGVYGQYLMFGIRSVPHAVAMLAREPFTLVGLALALVWVAPLIFARRYDPPLMGLFLIGVFYVYWWVFFTPGTIPRYLWFSYAIAGAFAGVMVWEALTLVFARRSASLSQLALIGVSCLVLIPVGGRVSDEAKRVYLLDEMASDRAVADYVRALPDDAEISTTWWPLAGALNFLADRSVTIVERVPDSLGPGETVIVDADRQPQLVVDRPQVKVSHYIVYTGEE